MLFLEIESLSIKAFETRVLESTTRIGNRRILQQLINSGTDMGSFVQAKAADYLEKLFQETMWTLLRFCCNMAQMLMLLLMEVVPRCHFI